MTGDESLELVIVRLLDRSNNRLGEIRELLEQRVEGSARSSVELVEDAKGRVHPTVKVYQGSSTEGLLAEAMSVLAEAKTRLPAEDTLEAWRATLHWARGRLIQDAGEGDAA